ncbi:diacylglycerol kinase [Cohnella kolymensis]|uniref:Diacylglycerol kinase n=1 Tax=Cohnella kolymensis TaxID=1590652 RepID=A0ABR5A0P5_9BACL|nr:diacylglycerol kinase family protein [Cohnella kolymensis]KIL34614.1 diacylglycerol kinase [Cohnella kolymensis]
MSGGRSHWVHSFRHAIQGIAEALRSERHMRFHMAAAALVVALALALKVPLTQWPWLFAAIAAVWTSELINTAIERTVDLASPQTHPLAKTAKDAAAGAVLVASLFAAAIGCIVLGPPLWKLCFG